MAQGLGQIAPVDSLAVGLRERVRPVAADLVPLLLGGALAATMMATVHLGIRVPGHGILKAILPLACGLAFVPRQNAGFVSALSIAAMAGLLRMGTFGGLQISSFTSLVLLAPALEFAMRGSHLRTTKVLRLVAAGTLTNLVALGVKLLATSAGWESAGGRGVAALWPMSAITYVICGALAGLVAAALCVPRLQGPSLGESS